jgi:3-oxoacyl-[acyl-carrier protein] reductase
MLLAGKIALVTGAQQGIGAATVLEFAREGADVAINWLDDEAAAEEVAGKARALGRRAVLAPGDLGSVEGARALVAKTVEALGRIDVLVNNAGVYPRSPFLELEEPMWDLTHAINLKGMAFCTQAAAKAMIAAGVKGAVVNISSQSAAGAWFGAHYAASKGGVISLTRSMALELAPHGIRVNGVAPGLVDTAQPRYGMTEEEIVAFGAASPMGRVGAPSEIATVALFLASEMSSYMTGEVVQANGGSYMT